MSSLSGHPPSDRAPRRSVALLFGAAAGAAVSVALIARSPFGDAPLPDPARVDTAPPASDATPSHVAGLDSGVDWMRVERASEEAGASVAVYDR